MWLFSILCSLFFFFVGSWSARLPSPVIGTYFPNWAQYRRGGFKFTPSSMSPVISDLNMIFYGFGYFCPNSSMVKPYWVTDLNLCQGKQAFDVIHIEPKDPEFYRTMVGFKQQNSELKVVLSIGGWNFPSNFYSGMVSSSQSRSHFIESCLSFMNQYGFDGIDLDWEFPNSPPRKDYVKISNTKFYTTQDEGGSPQDGANLALLVKEMREKFGNDKIISIASQADMVKATDENIKGIAQYIDVFNLMNYDYSVSDIDDAKVTAPNQPLYPPATPGIWNDSVSYTVEGYLNAGIPASKLSVGIAYYGHLWYAPGLGDDQSAWCKFGLDAKIQGKCAGPFKQTYGAQYGQYSQLCGTYMYPEILSAGFKTCQDPISHSNIGYAVSPSDGYTERGVWISYQDKDTITDVIKYAKSKGVAGVFSFDISMDTKSGGFTFELSKMIANLIRSNDRKKNRLLNQ